MKHLFSFYSIVLSICFLLLWNTSSLLGQRSIYNEDIKLKVKTTGKLLSANKLIMVIDIDLPDGWKLKVEDGYESMWQGDIDTVDMALKFRPNTDYQIAQRLKADRKPGIHGFYYEDVRFVQTIRINTRVLPLYIDAELKLSLVRKDEKDFAKANPCCLLQVCPKRKAQKTLNVGWDCDRREKVYLEDIKR
ncbi:hypothetical protein [Aureispira sp. CCB-QB1]|uniref:hypothetical protein n=1 Tax=Aureispira sp. CCB-QB1 TaxID=1313421 RepID=UPI000696C240|nr:hypothetical protein [Aureispira sp. CCB-QB1]